MATIQGLTKTRMLAIEAQSIVNAALSSFNLILTRFDGSTINVGSVRGPAGPTGPSGLAATEMGASVDLNTQTTPGVYSQTTDSEAASGTNYPVPYAGVLEVLANAAATQFYQLYTVINSGPNAGSTYSRSGSGGTWTAWQIIGSTRGAWTNLTLPDANVVAWDASGTGYQTPQYKLENGTVKLRGLSKTLTSRTGTFTIADITGMAPVETEVFSMLAQATVTSSASSAANTGAASTGTAHTHPIPHTHTLPVPVVRIDVLSTGSITCSPSSSNSLAANTYLSLSGISWDLN